MKLLLYFGYFLFKGIKPNEKTLLFVCLFGSASLAFAEDSATKLKFILK